MRALNNTFRYISINEEGDAVKNIKEKNFLKTQLTKRLPILKWLPSYKIKTYLFPDFFAGFTVGVMNIAQGKINIYKN